MNTVVIIGLLLGLGIAVFMGTLTILMGILGTRGEESSESLLGPVMIEDVLETDLCDTYRAARSLESDESRFGLAREIRRYIIELQAARCETGEAIRIDDGVCDFVEDAGPNPEDAIQYVRGLRERLPRGRHVAELHLDEGRR